LCELLNEVAEMVDGQFLHDAADQTVKQGVHVGVRQEHSRSEKLNKIREI
jgi:hypothetical protein